MKRDKYESRVYLPSSHDIRQACDRIQKGWSERERRKRAGWIEGGHWSPPLVEADSMLYDLSRLSDSQTY